MVLGSFGKVALGNGPLGKWFLGNLLSGKCPLEHWLQENVREPEYPKNLGNSNRILIILAIKERKILQTIKISSIVLS